MRLWRSVVGKLWSTIILLVAFVLMILTMLLLQFFEKYHVNQIEKELSETAKKVSSMMEAHSNDGLGEEIAFEIVDEPVGITIVYDKNRFLYSPTGSTKIDARILLGDNDLTKVLSDRAVVKKEISFSVIQESETGSRFENFIVAGVPFTLNEHEKGAVFVYQSLAVMKETSKQTTRLILLAAGIAIVLTTFFAFFLSTRITAPLRKMREAAFELSKGNFDT